MLRRRPWGFTVTQVLRWLLLCKRCAGAACGEQAQLVANTSLWKLPCFAQHQNLNSTHYAMLVLWHGQLDCIHNSQASTPSSPFFVISKLSRSALMKASVLLIIAELRRTRHCTQHTASGQAPLWHSCTEQLVGSDVQPDGHEVLIASLVDWCSWSGPQLRPASTTCPCCPCRLTLIDCIDSSVEVWRF